MVHGPTIDCNQLRIEFVIVFVKVRRRIILEPGKRDVEIIVNQVRRLLLTRMVSMMLMLMVAIIPMTIILMLMLVHNCIRGTSQREELSSDRSRSSIRYSLSFKFQHTVQFITFS